MSHAGPDAPRALVLQRVVSGGQTGADRGGLDAAIALNLAHGGFCPRGRRAEDGRIPARYQLQETRTTAYAERTRRNVATSDGTLIVTRGPLSGGTALTAECARARSAPLLVIDLDRIDHAAAASRVRMWLCAHAIATLNVAGPRESKCPGLAADARALVVAAVRSHAASLD